MPLLTTCPVMGGYVMMRVQDTAPVNDTSTTRKGHLVTENNSTEASTAKKTRKSTPALSTVLGEGFKLEAEVVEGSWKRDVTRTIPRDEYQIKLDRDGKKVYQEWLKNGRPAELDDCAKFGSRVHPDAVPVLTAYLRRVVGPGGPLTGKYLSVRTEASDEGKILVKVIYKDKPAKASA